MGEMRNTHRILSKNVKIPLVKRKHRWDDNIKVDVREIGGRLWNGLTWLRIATSGRLLWICGNFLTR